MHLVAAASSKRSIAEFKVSDDWSGNDVILTAVSDSFICDSHGGVSIVAFKTCKIKSCLIAKLGSSTSL